MRSILMALSLLLGGSFAAGAAPLVPDLAASAGEVGEAGGQRRTSDEAPTRRTEPTTDEREVERRPTGERSRRRDGDHGDCDCDCGDAEARGHRGKGKGKGKGRKRGHARGLPRGEEVREIVREHGRKQLDSLKKAPAAE